MRIREVPHWNERESISHWEIVSLPLCFFDFLSWIEVWRLRKGSPTEGNMIMMNLRIIDLIKWYSKPFKLGPSRDKCHSSYLNFFFHFCLILSCSDLFDFLLVFLFENLCYSCFSLKLIWKSFFCIFLNQYSCWNVFKSLFSYTNACRLGLISFFHLALKFYNLVFCH